MKVASKIIVAVYVAVLAWLVLFKFSLDISSAVGYRSGLNLIPFADASQGDLGDMISNFVVFVPLGLLLSVSFKQTVFRRKLAFIFGFSLLAELIQFAFAIGAADITDVIMNTSGGLFGLLLYRVNSNYFPARKLDRTIIGAGAILLVLLLGTLFSGSLRFQSALSGKALPPQSILPKNAQLAWPTKGQAAIGTVEDGLLARSSENEKPRPTASMAKVITALAILEKQPLERGQTGPSYALTAEDVANYRAYAGKGGSVLPVYEGMELTQYQALQAMLLPSANNLADMLAERTFGSVSAYTSYAQDMLKRMGLSRTVVADASGFDSATVSTPSELIAIGIAALKNSVLAEIVAQPEAWIPGAGTFKNTNELLGTDGVVGIKTGTTDQAGNCLLFAAHYTAKNGQQKTIIGVIMGDQNAPQLFSDSKQLLASAKQALGSTETQPISAETTSPARLRSRMLR